MIFFRYFLVLLLFVASVSCSKKKVKPTVERDYIKAYNLLVEDAAYSEAAKAFEKIEDDYPFSRWAPKAQTMAAYSYYKNEDYEDVDRVVEDFIRINPNSEAIPYMIYLRGVGYYKRIPDIKRAQDSARSASKIFRELKARFPESEYSQDSIQKLVVVDEHIAGAYMSVGRYEQSKGNYIGAIKNFQTVIYRYARTNQLPEAYFRLFEIYTKLGIEQEAEKAYFQLVLKAGSDIWVKRANKIKRKFK